MKAILKFFLSIFTIAIFAYVFYSASGMDWHVIYGKYFPCQRPIEYSLGAFDTKFGVSKTEFMDAIVQAEAIWEKPYNKELFKYNPEGKMKVNLVYDYRQQATDKIMAIDNASSGTRKEYNDLSAAHNTKLKQYNDDKAAYEERTDRFQAKQDAYNQEVAKENSNGGASPEKYQELKNAELEQRKEYAEIQSLQKNLQIEIDELNNEVLKINELAKNLNLNVTDLNNISQKRGEQFTEGEYVQNGGNQSINVYEFSTKQKLIRLLAHELGHSLGLDHVSDPNAVMYYLNDSKNGVLTNADLTALRNLCGTK